MIRGAAKNHDGVDRHHRHRPVRARAGRAAALAGHGDGRDALRASPSRPSAAPPSTTRPSPRIWVGPGPPVQMRPSPARMFPGGSPSRRRWSRASATARTRIRRRRSTGRRAGSWGLASAAQLHGPELGYNNLLDWSAALGLLLEFEDPAAVVIKHTNPCGVALGASASEAMRRAKACDPVSIYGGIVGVNRRARPRGRQGAVRHPARGPLRPGVRARRARGAPDDEEEVPRVPASVHARRVPVAIGPSTGACSAASSSRTRTTSISIPPPLTVVSRRAPTDAEMAALRFAWRVAKHAKSNAIVLSTADQVVGVGAGQMNRVDSARIAVMRARELGARDARARCAPRTPSFPFRDGLDVVARAGATAVIHPGRIDPGRRDRRRRRRARHGDGHLRYPPLQALIDRWPT